MAYKDRILGTIALFIRTLTIMAGLAILISAAGATQTQLFLPAVAYNSVGGSAAAVTVADVNRDSKLDIIVANYGSVTVLSGNGDGTFKEAVNVGYSSGAVAVADFNGDGKADLVVTACTGANCTGYVSILMGNGDGTFQSAMTYDSGGDSPYSVAVGDVNGDGKPDIVVADCMAHGYSCGYDPGLVGVLLGNGDGTFEAVASYASGGDDANSVAIADVNGDGKPDVLVANQCSTAYCAPGAIGVLLNKAPFCSAPPVVTVSSTPKFLWPPTGSMVPVVVTGTITDPDADCTIKAAAYTVTEEYGKVQPSGGVTLAPNGTYSFTVPLQASRLGSDLDGRYYTVTVGASNNAGETGSQSATVIVPHDLGR